MSAVADQVAHRAPPAPAEPEEVGIIGGVDTHKDQHAAAALDDLGRLRGAATFPATPDGYRQLAAWLAGFGPVRRVGVEGTSAWGAGLTRFLRAAGIEVIEVSRPNRQRRRRCGKSDPVDAETAARAVLAGEALGQPKAQDGPVEAIRALRVTRRSADHARTQAANQVRSLLDLDPKRDGLFDLVFSVNTIHHLRAHDLVLPHIKSLLAAGGHAVIVDIVDPGTWTSRDWHVQEAFRDALDSYRNRSRDHDAAADVLRLRLHPAWLDHVTTNIPLTRPLFHAAYEAVFPGAQFADDLNHVVAAMHWTDTVPA